MCFTNSEELADIIGSLRIHGKGKDKYDNVRIGVNGRIDTIQAAILLSKLETFKEEIDQRQLVASRYNQLLNDSSKLVIPLIPEGMKSAWAQYSILFETEVLRNDCQTRLKKLRNIDSVVLKPFRLRKRLLDNLHFE